jgi:hypothetical protein
MLYRDLPKNAPEDEWPVKWNLGRQKRLLGDLEELSVHIPWTEDRRKHGNAASMRAARFQSWLDVEAPLAERRPRRSPGPQTPIRLEFDLLRDAEGVIHLNPEIADRALQLRVP